MAKGGSIAEGQGETFTVGERLVAVFNDGGKYHAIDDVCPHMGASLCEGQLKGGAEVCHWHGWEFDLESGRPTRQSKKRATTYRVEVRDGQVWVELPQTEPDSSDDDWIAFDPGKHFS